VEWGYYLNDTDRKNVLSQDLRGMLPAAAAPLYDSKSPAATAFHAKIH
jgi:hypothetical protein